MVMVDTSAWVEYFRKGDASISEKVEQCLAQDLVAMGDLIYCEIMQGISSERQYRETSALLLSLPRYRMLDFRIAEKSARNFRMLRSRGLTIRKTIDVIIGTFCAENALQLVHQDQDFISMAPHIGLEIL